MEIPAILRDAVAQLFLILCDNTSAQWEGEWAFTDPLITHAIMNSLLNNDKEEKKGNIKTATSVANLKFRSRSLKHMQCPSISGAHVFEKDNFLY